MIRCLNTKWTPNCFVKDNIINNHNKCKELMCAGECEYGFCCSPPYTQHCSIVSNTASDVVDNLNDELCGVLHDDKT